MADFFSLVVQRTLVMVLLTALIGKLSTARGFAYSLRSELKVPKHFAGGLAWAVLATETAVIVALLWYPGIGMVGAGLLFLAFASAGAVAESVGTAGGRCGCIGRFLDLRLGWHTTILNAVVALIAASAGVLNVDSRPLTSSQDVALTGLAVLLTLVYWLLLYALGVLRYSALSRPVNSYD